MAFAAWRSEQALTSSLIGYAEFFSANLIKSAGSIASLAKNFFLQA